MRGKGSPAIGIRLQWVSTRTNKMGNALMHVHVRRISWRRSFIKKGHSHRLLLLLLHARLLLLLLLLLHYDLGLHRC